MISAASGHSTQKDQHLELTDAIHRFRGPLIGLIISWGAPHTDAAEIAQDSFADAWLNRDNCRGDLSDPKIFGAWLRGVAKNTHRNWARSRTRRERRVKLVDAAFLDVAHEPQKEADHDELTHLRAADSQKFVRRNSANKPAMSTTLRSRLLKSNGGRNTPCRSGSSSPQH